MSIGKLLGCASATNKRHPDDFYNTPPWATNQLIAVEQPPRQLWEPCSGAGAIVGVLKQHGFDVVEADLNPRHGQTQQDFLSVRERWAPALLTNPPFSLSTEWIAHCYDLKLDYVALLLKADVMNTDEKRRLVEHVGHPTRVWVLTARLDFLGQGAPPQNCSWFVWDRWHAPETVYRVLACPPPHLRVAFQYHEEKRPGAPIENDLFWSTL
jgi:hypothetical protein